jgi:hypothetical protein
MKAIGGDSGFHLRLTDEAYAGWKVVAEREGMTTSGLLEMVGRHLAARRPAVVSDVLDAATSATAD